MTNLPHQNSFGITINVTEGDRDGRSLCTANYLANFSSDPSPEIPDNF